MAARQAGSGTIRVGRLVTPPMRRFALLAVFFVVAAACSVDAGAGGGDPVDQPRATEVPATGTLSASPSETEFEEESPPSDFSGEEAEEEESGPPSEVRPPDLVVTGDAGDSITLAPVSFCWTQNGVGICADGIPQEPYPVLTADRAFTLDWPVEGWVWGVTSAAGTGFCNPSQQLSGVVAGDVIEIPGGAQVGIFGRGPEGDAWFVFASELADPVDSLPTQVSFGWHSARGEGEAPGLLSVNIANLKTEPETVDVVAIVESGDTTVEIPVQAEWSGDCWSGAVGASRDVGSLLDGVAPPFMVRLTVRIDDQILVSEPLVWPDDFADGSADEGMPLTMTEG